MSVVDNSIHDGISEGRLRDELVPVFDWDLRSDDEGMFVTDIFNKVVEDELVGFLEGMESEVIKNKEVVFGDDVEFFEVVTVGFIIEELSEDFGSGSEHNFKAFKAGSITDGGCEEWFSDTGGACDEDVFTSLNKIAGSKLEDIRLDETLSFVGEINLFKDGILPETGLREEVLTSSVVSFLPFCLHGGSHDFVGAGRFEDTVWEGCLVGIFHSVQPHLREHLKGWMCGDHTKSVDEKDIVEVFF